MTSKHLPRPVALVTGATGGMGRHIVDDLARTHSVVALGRNAKVLAELAALGHVATHELDITDYRALISVVEGLERLDVVVHAAAISVHYTVADAKPETWREHFETNVFAPAELTRLTLPLLRASQGTVIFIGSGASTKPAPGHAVYTASKHALQGLADTLRIDEATTAVRVSTIAPGPTDSGMLRAMQREAGDGYNAEHYIRPATIAAAVRYVVDAPPDAQLTDIAVRPRIELSLRQDG